MHTSIQVENMTDATLPIMKILLAESDTAEVARIKSTIDPEFQGGIQIVKTYYQLVESVVREEYQLVILGKIDNSNYSEISNKCHQARKSLPIVLLSSQGKIIDSFRQLVKTCGLADVISRDSGTLNQLISELNAIHQRSSNKLLGTPTYTDPEHLPSEPRRTGKLTNQAAEALPKPKISGQMVLAALEEIVTLSNNYFGPLAQGNYWRKAHARCVEESLFIQNWSADHFSKLSCHEKILEQELTAENIRSLRLWVQFFIEECERIIVDFRSILNNSALSPIATYLLTKT
ncbi:hypothetical protein [Chamaesiphon minutus]|uniref:Uncharacterized protein n=1 Tax=Chamaesiphon minutus (strain ATCC 27169 / PCC 6605) TaxID=1173020 RepID=K9ULK6_CHAP6|nr:hypothetical protein [Chamaesiphon minutus]AFY95987.1 hypothetical protein Cha6605_5086 [Chamaesiphon minutus PCC 6605]